MQTRVKIYISLFEKILKFKIHEQKKKTRVQIQELAFFKPVFQNANYLLHLIKLNFNITFNVGLLLMCGISVSYVVCTRQARVFNLFKRKSRNVLTRLY